MKIALVTTLPNSVAMTLEHLLGSNLCILDIANENNKKDSIVKMLHEHTPDTLITYRCPYILSNDILATLPLGAYNIHPSLLPKYKGLNPWDEIFRNHESESGVTLHRITKEIDGGAVVSQKMFIITPFDTLKSARTKADKLAAGLAKDFVVNLQSNASLLPLPNKFDYQEAIISPENLLFLEKNDNIKYNGLNKEGKFCIVFQMFINGEKCAVRCWKCLDEISKQVIYRRLKLVSEWMKDNQPSYLYDIFLYKNGIKTIKGIHPIAIMEWQDDLSLKEYLSTHIQETHLLAKLSDSFITMVSYFHNLHIAHGDMNLDNIRVKVDGSLHLIDYDTFYVPTMKQEKDNVKGKPEYQHRVRNKNMYISEYMDYFSEYVIYLTIKSLAKYPELWNLFGLANKESHIFSRDELSNIQSSRIYSFVREKNDEELMTILYFMDNIWKYENTLNSITPIEKYFKHYDLYKIKNRDIGYQHLKTLFNENSFF